MSIPFWVMNLSPARLAALEARWSRGAGLTDAQLKNPWQQVRIQTDAGPVAIPGLCRLRKMKRKLRAQKNPKSGGDGGSATIRGLVNPEFELEIGIYTPSQLAAWVALVPTLDIVGKGDRSSRRQIDHPLTRLCGVVSVSFLEVEYTAPEAGEPLKIKLGLLGYGQETNGTTKTTKAKAMTTVATANLAGDGQAPSRVPELIRPPGPAR